MKYEFKTSNQSPWIVDVYNDYIPYKTNGFVVEIGVGHTFANIDSTLPDDLTGYVRCSSNTADLLDIGWSGIYIDPVKMYCDEARISHKYNLDRLKIINIGASNKEDKLKLYLGDTYIPNNLPSGEYEWIHKLVPTQVTSVILENNNCPKHIDIMSIDVEGFELKVISGINFNKHIPFLIICETNTVSQEAISSILPTEYKNIKSDGLNTVWVLKK